MSRDFDLGNMKIMRERAFHFIYFALKFRIGNGGFVLHAAYIGNFQSNLPQLVQYNQNLGNAL